VLWIIDPLDGTVNFAHNIPHFSISIAAWHQGAICLGLIYQPLTGELFFAEKDKGAFLNGKKLSVTNTKDLNNAIFATGFPYNADQNPLQCIDRFDQIVKKGFPIRRLGSAALDLAYVAAGRFDAYWEVGLHPWDIAAGKLMVEEAGGMVTHYDGKKHQIFGYFPLLSSNRLLHASMVELLSKDLS
jgi:myo-inositol-1(or 4)-monophosphatase